MKLYRPVWQITLHAARRYAERVEASVDARDAKHRLLEALSGASLLPEPSILGDEQWSLSSGAVVVGKRVGRLTVAVTVLSVGQRETVAEVVDAARRISEEQIDDLAPIEVVVKPKHVEDSVASTLRGMRAERNKALAEVARLEAEVRRRQHEVEAKDRHLVRITAHAATQEINAGAFKLALRAAVRAARRAAAEATIDPRLEKCMT